MSSLRRRIDELIGPEVTCGEQLQLWIEAVASFTTKVNLTAARNEPELVDLMLADAVHLAARLPRQCAVVDVGSGAGAPGLALALLRPDLRLSLVEPQHKRAAFLRLVLGRLAADSALPAEVIQERGERLERRFDVAVSRATLPPPKWLALGAELAPRGQVWLLLAREPAPRLEGWTLVEEEPYRWPLTDAERRAACYRPSQPPSGSIKQATKLAPTAEDCSDALE